MNDPPQIPGYDFVRRLGSGAEATVYLYRQLSPARPVAIKVSNRLWDPRMAAHADFMSSIPPHPHILPIFDSGVTRTGFSYTISEFASGGSYKDVLRNTTLGAEQMLDLGINLASAVFTAHRNGIIHRDIKPGNVLIGDRNVPKLADFGISSSIYEHHETGYSLPWAPPEVILGTGCDEASDIYSLGAMLFATIAGRSPYEYAYRVFTEEELAAAIVEKPLPRLGDFGLPPQVERVLDKALSKNPDQRYRSALDFARAMQRVQFEVYGHATPITVEGLPKYPNDLPLRSDARITDVPTDSRQSKAGTKSIAIGAAAMTAVATVTFAFLVVPRMDSVFGDTYVANSAMAQRDTDGSDGIVMETVPSVENLVGRYENGMARFTWTNPDPKEGDSYAWSIVGDSEVTASSTTDTQIDVPATDGARICIQISLIRADRQMSQNPTIACAADP